MRQKLLMFDRWFVAVLGVLWMRTSSSIEV